MWLPVQSRDTRAVKCSIPVSVYIPMLPTSILVTALSSFVLRVSELSASKFLTYSRKISSGKFAALISTSGDSGSGSAMRSVNVFVAGVSALFRASTLTSNEPDTVGMPLILPEASLLNPDGRPSTIHVIGCVPVAVRSAL